ncbi:Asp23/Gls24 family envelope stress response protein [Streptomyces inhibens]|uniref:Asp23/Gls24 family envelope stress response protein n=1 Tax=Streptomyces inhibens TaxID=2293571 RepID=A0A371PXY7_STRIH|nr:Asp23/Gls24 family envelope stress response protein [Streptomyces inhibens]REK86943.1 Asp23/Gls24 family envelope stress response protein [Streptomyces inhibens]
MTTETDRPSGGPSGERGAITIADRVVAKIASQVAREALNRFGEAAGYLAANRPVPHVTVSVQRTPERKATQRQAAVRRPTVLGEARLHIAVELGYPSDIGAQCAAVRREVTRRLRAWAGMDVPDLAVSVARLHSVHSQRTNQRRVR